MADIVIRSSSPLILAWSSSPDWMDSAACAGDPDPERWFRKDAAEARTICGWCRVREDCGTWALKNGIEHGTWGDLTEADRQGLKPKSVRPRPGFTRS